MGGLDYTTWQALGLTLTLLGLVLSVLVWRRRGAVAGLRGVGWSLLPLAAALTGTLQLLWRVGDAAADWAVRLVFSPGVWVGLVLAGVSVVLLAVTGVLRRRRAATGVGRAAAPGQATVEAILRRHGIS